MENSHLDLPESKIELTKIILSNAKEIERLEEEVRLLSTSSQAGSVFAQIREASCGRIPSTVPI